DGAQLVVWPETAVPFFFQEPGERRQDVLDLAAQTRTPLVIGTPAFRRTPFGDLEQRNRAYLISPTGQEVAHYDKMELVPFGEYVPFRRVLFFVDQVVQAVALLGAGEETTFFWAPGARFGVLIC